MYFILQVIRKSGWLLIWIMLLYSDVASAKVKFYSLVEKTRSADLIIIADVVEVKSDQMILLVTTPLKGLADKAQVGMDWSVTPHGELPKNIINAKDTVLVFANPSSTGVYKPFAGVQGVLKLEPGWGKVYEDGITKILRFDSANTPESKSSILKSMLSGGNRISEYSALEIIYLEHYSGKFPVADLLEPVTLLAKSSDKSMSLFAIQLLGRIGNKETVPFLIEIIGGQDEDTAAMAYHVLKGMVNTEMPIDIKQSSVSRKSASKDLLKWWSENKKTIVLRR